MLTLFAPVDAKLEIVAKRRPATILGFPGELSHVFTKNGGYTHWEWRWIDDTGTIALHAPYGIGGMKVTEPLRELLKAIRSANNDYAARARQRKLGDEPKDVEAPLPRDPKTRR